MMPTGSSLCNILFVSVILVKRHGDGQIFLADKIPRLHTKILGIHQGLKRKKTDLDFGNSLFIEISSLHLYLLVTGL